MEGFSDSELQNGLLVRGTTDAKKTGGAVELRLKIFRKHRINGVKVHDQKGRETSGRCCSRKGISEGLFTVGKTAPPHRLFRPPGPSFRDPQAAMSGMLGFLVLSA